MNKKMLLAIFLLAVLGIVLITEYVSKREPPQAKKSLKVAVEFVNHAACAFIARHKGFFEDTGLDVAAFDCYVTGTALAAALARDDVDAAYICLIPAIVAYANAKVPVKIVAGLHKYGYALIVNQSKVNAVEDLENPNVRIACMQKGSATEVLFRKMIEKYRLNEEAILSKIRYMNPPLALFSLKMGQIDAAILPEHYPTMAEELGFKVLLTAEQIWPYMQGSVLIVKEGLMKNQADTVEKLVEVTQLATQYIYDNLEDASQIVAKEMQVLCKQVLPSDVADITAKLELTPEIISRSLAARVKCTNDIDSDAVQDAIEYMAKLGYISWFRAEEILDLRFLEGAQREEA